jgi:hypothetical protein
MDLRYAKRLIVQLGEHGKVGRQNSETRWVESLLFVYLCVLSMSRLSLMVPETILLPIGVIAIWSHHTSEAEM